MMDQGSMFSPQQYAEFDNIGSLKLKLKNDQVSHQNPLKFTHHSQRYLYVSCKVSKCQWKLRYKYSNESGTYCLKTFIRQHNHQSYSSLQLKASLIQNFIRNIPRQVSLAVAKHLTLSHLRISLSSFYYYYKKIHFPRKNISQLLRELDKMNYSISISPFQLLPTRFPDLLIIITPLMKKNFLKYGKNQFTSFDLTFNIIKDPHPETGIKYKVGCFMGLSCCRRLVPFGLVVTDIQTKNRYYEIIKNFALNMESFSQVLITDESLAMLHCVEQFQNSQELSFHHSLDIFHVLRNVRKKLLNKSKIKLFSQLAKVQTKQQFQLLLSQQIEKLNEEDQIVLRKFVHSSQKYCFSYMPNAFFGFLSSDNINQKMHDLIKTKIPIEKGYTQSVYSILQLLQSIGNRCEEVTISKLQIDVLYNNIKLKQLIYCLDEKVLNPVVKSIQKSLSYSMFQQTDLIIIRDKNNLQFHIRQGQQYLQCSCNYILKVGLPCSHLIKVLMMKEITLKPYIHKRWLLENVSKIDNRKSKLGRGRNTRRKR